MLILLGFIRGSRQRTGNRMEEKMKRMRLGKPVAVLVGFVAVLAIVGATPASAETRSYGDATYQVTIRNTTEGQYLTPPNFAAHTNSVRVFQFNRQASPGVQAVAENGGVDVLAAELTGAVDDAGFGISGVGADAPIPPGGEATFEFTTDLSNRRLSIVSMVICTNDGFAGLDSKSLPVREGKSRTFLLPAYDAGTEINTELRQDLVPAPFCGEGDGSGESNPELAENGKIRLHKTLQGVGDLDPALDWKGAVAEVTVTRVPAPETYTVTVENATSGQYLTPPNYAFHTGDVRVFQRKGQASPGVQAVAENGGVDVLAAELTGAVDDAGFGISGVGADAPLSPGASSEFTVTTDASHFSLVSMVICTNDGFGGIDSASLPRWPGDTRTIWVPAYDAGTEINTELRQDLVPAPFCGEGEGSGESNPELAENGSIQFHRTLLGVGDLDPSLDWRGPVMKVTITRN